MMTLDGYKFSEKIYLGTRTEVYRGTRISDLQPVIIKVLLHRNPNFNQLVQFRNQYVITRNTEQNAIVQPLALERYGNGYALVMPDDGAIALCDYWPRSDRSLTEFIAIALQLADALHYLTQERIVHKDIKPANILIHPETRKVKLIDFSISTLLPKEQQQLINPNVLEGTLAYISPEQTGRMNRGIDYRTDFYSLGVTFFELLTGQLPFITADPMELVHCHIAQAVQFPVDSQVDEVVQAIVLKLMAKNAENRYQSALGLQHDLRICLQQLEATGKITRFEIGKQDRCDRFIIPEKLYGRSAEVQTLLSSFDRVSAGATEMMLVAGFSGIGKTAVVNEVHKPIARQRGYFIKGKFDQFNRNIPFSAFVQAFRDLMGQLLGESDASLANWKAKILKAVGENGQVLIDVIPELEHIIGKQPPAPELSGSAAQNRFNLLFEKFIAVFTTKEHPLTIFVDDLQWADSASLNLMKVLMGDSQTRYLLLLGAYRDNEVFPAHPLMLSLAELEKQQTTILTITLAPLSVGHINQLVAETLSCVVELAVTLTDLVYQKTRGNPFFTTQFLKGLHSDGLITFNQNLGYWECDLVKVRDAALTDEVVAFMAGRLHKLPEATQEVLKLAACIGNQFDLETLAIICETPSSEVAADLWSALREGLILPQSEAYKFFQGWEKDEDRADGISVGYRFLHDRVQQAAYSLIPEDKKQQKHLTIGRLLLGNASEENLEDKIFDIVNHFNVGLNSIARDEEKQQLCKLNFQAGCKAKNATAYGAAIEYLLLGIELLAENSWERDYKLTLELYESAAESAYLEGEFENMEQLCEMGLNNARTLLDTIKFYEVKIQALEARARFQEALDTAMVILEKLGIRQFPKEPDSSDIELGLNEVKANLGHRNPRDIRELPAMTDPKVLAAMRILNSAISSAYKAKPMLMILMTFEAVILSLKYGNAPVSVFIYSMQGLVLCSSNDIELGYQFGELASQLLLQSNTVAVARTLIIIYGHIKHYKEHLRNSIDGFKEAYSVGLETGDLEFAGYGLAYYSFYSYLSGKELLELVQEMSANSMALKRIKKTTSKNWNDMYYQMVENLLGRSQNPCSIVGEAYDEEKMLPLHKQANDLTTQAHFYVPRVFLCYLFQDLKGASESLDNAEKCVEAAPATPLETLFYFYQSLVMLAELASQPKKEYQNWLAKITANQKILRETATHAPTNYLHKWCLVEAEKHRVLGEKMEALEQYDRAIALAKENDYLQEEALANELAAKFYLDWGKEKIAAVYMQEAYYCYARWGAKAKTDQLERKYPQLLHPLKQQASPMLDLLGTLTSIYSNKSTVSSTGTQTSQTNANRALDLLTILKASQAISSTIDTEELLGRLTEILLQISGGDRCAIVLCEPDSQLRVRALATAEATELGAIALEDASHLPVQLIQYVKHTRETLVMDSPDRDLPVVDRYLAERQPHSVLCMPLVERDRLRGVLYLENQATKGVFQGQRLVALNLLATTAAIALENARLYQQARDYTRQLEESQLQLVQSEKMSALGNLVAGVGHEINNPLGFVSGNIKELRGSVNDLVEGLQLYQQRFPEPGEDLEEQLEDLEIYFLLEDIPKMLDSMEIGCDRIHGISTSLRTFSRADTESKLKANLHEGIESTLLILTYRLKAKDFRPEIQVIRDYGELPEISCFPGQLNQVFMNLLANAIDMFDEMASERSFGELQANPQRIAIRTKLLDSIVEIRISDNGKGMSEEVRSQIFDRKFTTKAVGKGTGLGLAIARQIVEEKHGGAIACQSQLGKGTEFIISLPLS